MPASARRAIMILLAAGVVIGCDTRQRKADKQVEQAVAASYQIIAQAEDAAVQDAIKLLDEAATLTSASPATRATLAAAQAHNHLSIAQDLFRRIDQTEIELSRLVWEIGQLTDQVQTSASAVRGYRQYDPKAARQAIAERIADAQGGPGKPAWFTHDRAIIPTLAAVIQDIARIEGDIAQAQQRTQDLAANRGRILEQADQAAAQAQKLKGQVAVAAFKRSSDFRKEAGDLAVEVAKVESQIELLQRDLAIARGQQATLTDVIAQLQNQAQTLDESWKQVDAQIRRQNELVQQILQSSAPSASPDQPASTAGASVVAKSAAMGKLVAEIHQLRVDAITAVDNAIRFYGDAYNRAEELRQELQKQIDDPGNAGRPERKAWENLRDAMNPLQFKLQEAAAQRALASQCLSEARSAGARDNLKTAMMAALDGLGLNVPQEVVDGDLAAERTKALKRADAAYSESERLLTDVIEGRSPERLKDVAHLAKALTYYGWAQVARQSGDETAARERIQQAVLERNLAAERDPASLPPLPAELGSPPQPPPPAQAVAEPVVSDEQAVRDVLNSFADAIDRGDLQAARALSQIEPGQGQQFEHMITLGINMKKFREAVKSKFGDASQPALEQLPDVSNMLRTGAITIKGDDAFIAGLTDEGQTRGDLVRVGGKWKILFEEPRTAQDKAEAAMAPRMAAVLEKFAADIESGRYATIQDASDALAQEIQSMGGAQQ